MVKKVILICLGVLLINSVFAFPDSINTNIQIKDSSGNVKTGTYIINFSIARYPNCSDILYSSQQSLTTDVNGVINFTLENIDIDFSQGDYALCYYKDNVLTYASNLSVVPYSFFSSKSNYSQYVNTTRLDSSYCNLIGCTIDGNLNVSKNLTITWDTSSRRILGTYTNTVAGLGESKGDLGYFVLSYNGISGTPTSYQGSALHLRSYYGSDGTNAVGTLHGLSSQVRVTNSGSSSNEFTPLFTDLSVDANGRLWGADLNVHGPVSTQSNLIQGISQFVNNYNSGAITNGGFGEIIVTYPGQGGGDARTDRESRTTYPLTSGLAIVGKSGTSGSSESTATNGFNTALQIGGYAGGWMTSSFFSKFGTGIDIQDYVNYGVYIHDKSGGASGTVNSILIDRNSGLMNLTNNNLTTTGNINTGILNLTGNLIVNNSVGLTGNYSVGICWQYFIQGILKATNCTSV